VRVRVRARDEYEHEGAAALTQHEHDNHAAALTRHELGLSFSMSVTEALLGDKSEGGVDDQLWVHGTTPTSTVRPLPPGALSDNDDALLA
jgi:hypothetical protein